MYMYVLGLSMYGNKGMVQGHTSYTVLHTCAITVLNIKRKFMLNEQAHGREYITHTKNV